MHVAAILKAKGRAVETVAADETLGTVVALLAERRIGAVVVSQPSRPIAGIVSERDIVRMLARHGAATLALPVSEAMTRDVVTCRETDTLDELMSRMTEGRFRHLPVEDNGQLVGIVSIGDVVKHRVAEVELEASAMRDYIASA
jgi:CBS domain-containing protein